MSDDEEFKELIETCTMECLHDGHRKRVADAAEDIAKRLEDGSSTLGNVIDGLNSLLTDDDERVRQRGTRALADIVTHALEMKDAVKENARRVLTTFFLERVEDSFSFSDTLRGAAAILCAEEAAGRDQHALLPAEVDAALETLKSVLRNAATVSMPVSARVDVLYVVSNLCDICKPEGDFAVTVALSLRVLFIGERDPSLLKNSFMLLAKMLHRTAAGSLGNKRDELLFDAFSAYFPVLFVPRGSPVTKDELVISLRMCFAATPLLAHLVFPFLIDKTASSIASAQADAFATLASCIRAFGAEVCGPELPQKILDSLRANAFGQELPALIDAVGILSSAVTDIYPPDVAEKFFHDLFETAAMFVFPISDLESDDDFDEEISNTGRKIMIKLFQSKSCFKKEGGGDPCSFVKVVKDKLDSVPEDKSKFRYLGVAALADMAEALVKIPTGTPGVKECADLLAGFFIAFTTNKSEPAQVFENAGRGCASLAEMPPTIVGDDAVTKQIEEMMNAAVDTERTEAARTNAFSVLAKFAAARPQLVATRMKSLLEQSGADESSVVLKGAETVSKCSVEVFRPVFDGLTDLVLKRAKSGSAPKMLLTVWQQVATYCKESDSESLKLADSVIRRIVTFAGEVEFAIENAFRTVIRSLLQMLPLEPHTTVFNWMLEQKELPFCNSLGYYAAISSAKKSVVLTKMPAILLDLVEKRKNSIKDEKFNSDRNTASALAIASIFNKTAQPDWLAKRESVLRDAVERQDCVLLAWLCRASLLIADDSRMTKEGIDSLISLAERSVEAGKCFGVVCAKDCPVREGLIPEADAVISEGYCDRLYSASFAKLLSMHEADSINKGVLIALANVLSTVPASHMTENAAKCAAIARGSLAALKHEDDAMPTLLMLGSLLKNVPQLFTRGENGEMAPEKFGALLSRLCNIAAHQKDAHSRAEALDLLLFIRRNVAECHTMPYQRHVVSQLTSTIDDPKRPVRVLGVRCRNAWMVFLPSD